MFRNSLSSKLFSSVDDVTNGVGPCTHLKMILNNVNAAVNVRQKHTVFNNVDKKKAFIIIRHCIICLFNLIG